MLASLSKFRNPKYSLILGVLLVAMTLGYLGAYLGFARPRGFKGDFFAAMYNRGVWDGRGIFYGPLFVFERWVVDWVPSVATIQFFAIGTLILIILSMLVVMKIGKFQKRDNVYILLVWTLNTYLYYSFSVVSNPELIQLFFLILTWYGLSKENYPLAWIALTLAALTKLIPFFLFPILLIFFSWTGFLASITIIIFTFIILSVGQSESITTLITQIIRMNTSSSGSNTASPQPDSEQFLGLSSAIARLLGMRTGQDFTQVTTFSNLIIFILYILILAVSIRISRSGVLQNQKVLTAYIFALFMSLLPFMHLSQTHRHTFLYLTPVWVAMRFVYNQDPIQKRSDAFKRLTDFLYIASVFLPIYFLDFFNVDNLIGIRFGSQFLPSLIMLTEPIWVNLVLVLSILYYGLLRTRRIRNSQFSL
jgi:hypothetical protein